jgi:Protein of unknown function (DUF3102)
MPRTRQPNSSEKIPNTNLDKIAKKIKAKEKGGIRSVIEIGRLLHEASEQCEHGEYMDWLKREFEWSHDTAMNYRNVYELSQNPNCSDFDQLNISATALYVVAKMKGDDQNAARDAVLEAARKGRVSRAVAAEIIEGFKPPSAEPDPEPGSESESESESLISDDDESLVPDDEDVADDEEMQPPEKPPNDL